MSDVRDIWPDQTPDPLANAVTLAEIEAIARGVTSAVEEDESAPGLKLIRADQIANVEQKWLVSEFLPDCTLSILAGLPGVGKTTCALSIAAAITLGQIPVIGGSRPASDVLMLTNEDSPSHIRRVFERLGGELSKLWVESDQGLPWTLDDCASLEDKLIEGKPSLAIIDSFFSHAPAKVDPHKHNEVAPALLRLRRIAETSQCAILLIHHGNKSSSDQPLLKIAGSVGITAVSRHVLYVGAHPDDETLRVVGIAKSNVTHAAALSQVFKLDPFGWIGSSNVRASDILQPVTVDRRDEAADFLRRVLTTGSKNSSDLQELARGEGISWASVRRAQQKLRIRPRKAAMSGAWVWALPQAAHEDAHLDAHPKNLSTLSTLSTFDQTNNLLTTSIVSPHEDAQFRESEHLDEHLRDEGSNETALPPPSGGKLPELEDPQPDDPSQASRKPVGGRLSL